MGRSPASQPTTLTASQVADRQLVAAALQTQRDGGKPTGRELAALRRYEQGREDHLRWQYYRTIPQKHWRQMGGGWQARAEADGISARESSHHS